MSYQNQSKSPKIKTPSIKKSLQQSQYIYFSPLAIAALGDEEQLAMAVGQQLARMQQPVKVIHKEHEAVTAFCINKVSR